MISLNETIIKKLEARGAIINYDVNYDGNRADDERRDDVRNIKIPLTAEEWVQMCTRDGDKYIGGCCGQTGYTQDIINDIFRDGWLESTNAIELLLTGGGHDGFELLTETDETKLLEAESRWEELDSLDKLFLCVAAVRPRLHVRSYTDADLNQKSNDIQTLASAMRYLSATYKDRDEDKDGQHKANVQLNLIRAVPSATKFLEQAHSLAQKFIGFAIVDEKNEIQSNGYGKTIYLTENAGLEMIRLWDKPENEDRKEVLSKLRVKKIRLTLERGVEFL